MLEETPKQVACWVVAAQAAASCLVAYHVVAALASATVVVFAPVIVTPRRRVARDRKLVGANPTPHQRAGQRRSCSAACFNEI
eukprot:COSAG05_NODE_141_length_16655_cov_22.580963_3_plen_83_part_00